MGPALVVGDAQFEQARVARLHQELRMVLEALGGIAVLPKALAPSIVVVVHLGTRPVAVAFDAEVVVRLAGQLAVPVAALQQALRQRDAGRDAVLLHLLHRHVLPQRDVLLRAQPLARGLGHGAERQHTRHEHCELSVHVHFVQAMVAQAAKLSGHRCDLHDPSTIDPTGPCEKNVPDAPARIVLSDLCRTPLNRMGARGVAG